MNIENSQNLEQSHLMWIYPDSLFEALDSATWLDTTNELRKLGWRVTLVSAGPPGNNSIRDTEITCISQPNIYFLRQVIFHIRVLRLILQDFNNIDIILFHQMSAPWLLPLRLIRRITGHLHPLLVMDTRTVPMTKATWKDQLRAWFYNLMNGFANRWADGQTAITMRMAQLVQIPPHQLWGIWPSGVNLDRFTSASATRNWPSSSEVLRLIYIGALYPERNLLALCEAVEQSAQEKMGFILSIIGKGPQRSTLQEFAKRSPGSIQILSPVPHDQMPRILADHHIGVLPFPDQEIFRVSSPVKLFEYMASGMPILATRIPCFMDVVGDDDFIFWTKDSTKVGLFKALCKISQPSASLKDKGISAAKAAQSFSWQQSAIKLSDSLERGELLCRRIGIQLSSH